MKETKHVLVIDYGNDTRFPKKEIMVFRGLPDAVEGLAALKVKIAKYGGRVVEQLGSAKVVELPEGYKWTWDFNPRSLEKIEHEVYA